MIDSHCHLDHEPLFTNLDEVIRNSKKVGIDKILTICTTLHSFENIIKITKVDRMIYGTFGIHPHETINNVLDTSICLDCSSLRLIPIYVIFFIFHFFTKCFIHFIGT